MQYENFNIYYDKKGYPIIWINGKNVKLHVYIWEKIYGNKPKGYDIHHKDFNKNNYDINNLELLTVSDHKKIHAGWIKKDKEWILKPCKDCKKKLPLNLFYQRKGLTPSQRCIKCSAVYFKNKALEKDFKEKRKIYMQKYYSENKKEKWGVK